MALKRASINTTFNLCVSVHVYQSLCLCLSRYSYNYELVFGVGVHGLNKADRLIYGESLMTHAMVLTAVHEQVTAGFDLNSRQFTPLPFCR